jgi:hypothetical protein
MVSSNASKFADHAESVHLFGRINPRWRNLHIALPGLFIGGTSVISSEVSAPISSTVTLDSEQTPKTGNERVCEDQRLQTNLFRVWQKFVHLGNDLLEFLPPGQRYVVQEAVEIEASCPAASSPSASRFFFRYSGIGLKECPFRVPTRWRSVVDLDMVGRGLIGIPEKLNQLGDSILLRLNVDKPLGDNTLDQDGAPRPGFWFPCQFCRVTLVEKRTRETRYHLTFYPAPIGGSS